ncbi:predicted protein [Histoplasma mississippiense (nom. inval.)]|uniref:predicted protein n=1 Tax=Ajellomyces capsulatus (strain NAm1 / WU24) TaxID=2059318 RepID=UPI000157CC4F|nr:predicted protein [Histoplasma mississippiense (nom. inval.)]EDN09892.1 predicted protein [Histoplasma mississippiense (nom. inval.)]
MITIAVPSVPRIFIAAAQGICGYWRPLPSYSMDVGLAKRVFHDGSNQRFNE